MSGYNYVGSQEEFRMNNPELYSYLYFPLANENGVMSSIAPDLAGDCKMGQNMFLMPPVSSENLHNDKSSRNIWCKVNGKEPWSLTGRSAIQQSRLFNNEKEETVLEAGFMNQTITRTAPEMGLSARITNVVPYTGEKVELMRIELTNLADEELTLQVVAAIPIYARSADNIRDHRHVTALLHRIYTTDSGVAVKPTMTFDERGHRKNEVVYGVFGGNAKERPAGYYPILEDFIGEGGNLENPKALHQDTLEPVTSGEEFGGYEALGGLCFRECRVKPKEKLSYIIAMGCGSSVEALEETAAAFLRDKAFEKILQETEKYWQDKVNVICGTGNTDFDKWMRWVSFQPMLRRIYGCSFLPHHDYGKGGRGWRDLWQDCLALLIMNPEGVRGMLLDNFGGVRIDGTNATIIGNGQGEFIADRNHITRVWMDHGVWPFLTVQLYIQQTGDIGILLEEASYFKDLQVCRGEEKDELWDVSGGQELRTGDGAVYEGSIIEHLLVQHLCAFYDVGEHNHIRLRSADWNDALDMAPERGESVAFTAMYAGNMEQLSELLSVLEAQGVRELSLAQELLILLQPESGLYDRADKKKEVLAEYCMVCRSCICGRKSEVAIGKLKETLQKMASWIKQNIRSREWVNSADGHGWYNGYYDNHGRAVEGENAGGIRMMLTSQVFTVMSETADEHQVDEIVKSADAYLYHKEAGGYRLNTDFHEVKMDLGRMFGFAYGHKENGAVFSHMAVMFGYALYIRGKAQEGYKVLNSLYAHCSDFEKSRIYPGVPEYIDAKGRGMYHYLTGAASWLLLTVVSRMFGIRGCLGDLEFEPQLVKEQFDGKGEASMELVFAGRTIRTVYRNVLNLEPEEYRIESIELDGQPYKGVSGMSIISRQDILQLSDERKHTVVVHLGRRV